MVLFGDRGTPQSVRHMNAYSGHTYKFIKAVSFIFLILTSDTFLTGSTIQDGSFKYAKIQLKTRQGVKNFTREEATKIAGENPDYMIQDMFEAIERGDYPMWDVYVQLMSPEEAEKYEWNIFDMTKIWPHKDYTLQKIGHLTLNRNVSFFQLMVALAD